MTIINNSVKDTSIEYDKYCLFPFVSYLRERSQNKSLGNIEFWQHGNFALILEAKHSCNCARGERIFRQKAPLLLQKIFLHLAYFLMGLLVDGDGTTHICQIYKREYHPWTNP